LATPQDAGSESIEEQVKSFLYLCPSCGEFVRAEDTSCSKCGASLGEEAHQAMALPEPDESPAADDADRCSECGATVAAEQTTCGVCGTPVGAERAPEPAETQTSAEAIAKDEALSELEGQAATEEADPSHAAREPPASAPEPEARPRATAKARDTTQPRPPPAPERMSRGSTLLTRWREYVAIVTGLAAPAAAAVAVSATGQAWGLLFAFGILFGIALFGLVLTFAIPDARGVTRTPWFLLWILGTTLAVAVPTAALTGAPLGAPAGLALLVAGAGLGTFAAWRLPRNVGIFLPWLSGLLILMVGALAPLAFASLGDPVAASGLWLIGSALAVAPAVLLVYRRYMASRAERRLASAEEALSKREYEKALELYEETLVFSARAGQHLGAALYGKGAALVAVGRLDDALEVLDRALSSDPGNEIAWVNKGTALTRMGRLQDALKCYNSAIRINAVYEVAWNNKGNALSRLGKNDWALRCYEHALKLDPSYRTAWVNKGYVLAKLGRFDEAAECADRALQLTARPSA